MIDGNWIKLGCIFAPSGESSWMKTHAAVPIAEYLGDDEYRIYFSARDIENTSRTGFIELNINNPFDTKVVSQDPVLIPGSLGEFDDSGAMASWLVQRNETNYLYYIGWNLGQTVPFRNSIGLAEGAGAVYKRMFKGPILDRTRLEPHFCASCCVLCDGDMWRMWYLSCTGWYVDSASKPQHRYHVKYATSSDGIDWDRKGIVAIDYKDEKEVAISRPSVIRFENKWHMWFSYRSYNSNYKIGYAASFDGAEWVRNDELAGIDTSDSGWDSEMIEYPYVFIHQDELYMLYNGNSFGATGVGLAIWQPN